ncbi:nonribosomal peptide synthetase-like protein [Grosmannia clavigera kw1407]|uniref:Nonribosomal peptide synthetase-like protein n=1 Tax=Grosmannia clavigera (strain kw1407 / UAMH 11150) TaxID=655863 RepID=F0XT49_GROCL|nr:nonribosomal peptide synthetase-like protein [Grosmannia clavigera kw1407]EFW99074.1 nonribosomal peptide synthetase-like protein [Grosmannia clavigera kw1407]
MPAKMEHQPEPAAAFPPPRSPDPSPHQLFRQPQPSETHQQQQQNQQPQRQLPDLASPSETPVEGSSRKRKRVPPELRRRVTRACDRCKRRKVRCTGDKPCLHCTEAKSTCTYDLTYGRGRLPPIPLAQEFSPTGPSLNEVSAPLHTRSFSFSAGSRPIAAAPVGLGERLSFLSEAATTARMDRQQQKQPSNSSISNPPSSGSINTKFSSNHNADNDTTTNKINAVISTSASATAPAYAIVATSSRVSPEPSQTDLQGHYVGPSSGVSFLLRVQKRLHETVSFSQAASSSIFTFGDAPLPEYDASFPLLLTRSEANSLLERYFDFAVPTHRFLHRPTVEAWLAEFYATKGSMASHEDTRARIAVLFMVFAMATEYMSPDSAAPGMVSSAQYFLAAEQQLSKERGSVRLASVQARLCQCFYLLAQSRINHCWSLFGTTAHLALAIGLNRNRRADPASGLGHIDVECRRRTFWCTYNLDNYLSAALGRPKTFHDEDIDQELPSILEDSEIFHDEIRPGQPRGQSTMLAPVAHVRLARIVSVILRDLYSIHPISTSTRASLSRKHSEALAAWRREISRFLDTDRDGASLLMPVFQRQINVLNLAYWHALLLTHRPLLLSNFAYLQRYGADSRNASDRVYIQESTNRCLDAAMSIIEIVDNISQGGQLFKAFWFTMYFAFSAVVVVYVYVIQHRSSPPETYGQYLSAAIECQRQIVQHAETGSLAQRYTLVLEELRLVTVKQVGLQRQTSMLPTRTPHAGGNENGRSSSSSSIPYAAGVEASFRSMGIAGIVNDPFDLSGAPLDEGMVDWNESPSSSLADFTSWGHFDSMVSSGFWPFDSIANEDPTAQALAPLQHFASGIEAKNTVEIYTMSVADDSSPPKMVNDLLLSRVRNSPETQFLGYPATSKGRADYVYHTVQDVDRYATTAAWRYLQSGLIPEHPSPSKAEVVAILAPSNFDYVVSIFALSRLGFAILFLSNRLAPDAIASLLRKTACTKLIVSANHAPMADRLRDEQKCPVSVFPIVGHPDYTSHASQKSLPEIAISNPSRRIAFIIHSSGSTGLPKPISQTHGACLANYAGGIPFRAFITLPLYHNHGISTLFRALCAGKKAALYNASLPLAGSTLVESIRAVDPESLHCVPYALKLMAEDARGIDTLKRLKLVLYGGSSCPDELGNRLEDAGIYLAGHYGATEMGQLMTSFRDPVVDKEWAYMRPVLSAKPFLRMVPRGDNTFECVVLDGLPSKVLSNSEDPPNSFYTRDLFQPHPTLPDAWKYLGRIDDRVTLINGEKVLPIPFEHQIRQHDLVRECVVFGIDRAVPGLAIIPSDKAKGLSKSALLDALMPVVDATNAHTEAFGRISREMIEILDGDTVYPATDKGTVIRAAFYSRFVSVIDAVYARFEAAPAAEEGGDGLRVLDETELETYLLDIFVNKLGIVGLQAETDLFEAGVDSLQAIIARAQIVREIDLSSKRPAQNVVFEYPTVRLLAQHLVSLRTGAADGTEGDVAAGEIQAMRDLIAKYSDFSSFTSLPASTHVCPEGREGAETVLLTGATGSLGVHILRKLVDKPHVTKIFCLVRASSQPAAKERVYATLAAKGLPALTQDAQDKVVCLPADLSQKTLGLDDDILAQLRRRLTTVVHAAWAVNFNLGVRSFEGHHIRGTYNLLNTCLRVEGAPARLFFCSSISAGAGTPIPGTVAETYIENLAHAQPMGYARSKVVTEHIIKAAAAQTGMAARVLRLGQIVGDADEGIWNTTEAIPLMLRSALTIGALPALSETPSWMPVDKMARAVMELSGLSGSRGPEPDKSLVYQVQNRRLFDWTEELLPALRAAGLPFKTVPQREWVELLRASDADPTRNPTIKLIDFFSEKYDNDRPGRSGLVFETDRTERASKTMEDGFDIIGSGLLDKMVAWWKTQWTAGAADNGDAHGCK